MVHSGRTPISIVAGEHGQYGIYLMRRNMQRNMQRNHHENPVEVYYTSTGYLQHVGKCTIKARSKKEKKLPRGNAPHSKYMYINTEGLHQSLNPRKASGAGVVSIGVVVEGPLDGNALSTIVSSFE